VRRTHVRIVAVVRSVVDSYSYWKAGATIEARFGREASSVRAPQPAAQQGLPGSCTILD